MPVPQIGDPVPYGEAPGYDKQARLYNHARLGDLLRGASPTPQAPPWNAPPNPNPFYRRQQPSIGQTMIEPPQQAGPQPDTSQNYIPYGGRF